MTTGVGGTRRRRPRMSPLARREAVAGLLFISPWILGFVIFTAGAMIFSLVLAFSRYNLASNTLSWRGSAKIGRAHV